MSKADLKLDWVTCAAARYACKHWHYSKTIPTPPYNFIGVWEAGAFIGVVIFSRGANNNLAKPYGLLMNEACELTRVALNTHKTPVSRILKIAVKLMSKHCPGIRLIISFADKNEGHHGGDLSSKWVDLFGRNYINAEI